MSRKCYDDYDGYDDGYGDFDEYDDYVPVKRTTQASAKAKGAKPAAASSGQKKATAEQRKKESVKPIVKAPAATKSSTVFDNIVTSVAGITVSSETTRNATPTGACLSVSDDELSTAAAEHDLDTDLDVLTLVVAGHVDAGKSTLVGNLLQATGNVPSKTMRAFERDSQAAGKGSFALAWVLDESQSERQRGVTIHMTEKLFEHSGRRYRILDAPGHKDFVPTMIKGATQADAALLVIPATEGEFESAMGRHAQTVEHAILLKALGVKEIIVVVNKMDATTPTPWSKERFEVIEAAVRQLLRSIDFDSGNVSFIPVSGLAGGNILQAPSFASLSAFATDASAARKCPTAAGSGKGDGTGWYAGPTLLAAVGKLKFQSGVRRAKPLRVFVESAVLSSQQQQQRGKGGTAASGTGAGSAGAGACWDLTVRVIQGSMKVGRTVGYFSNGQDLQGSSSSNNLKGIVDAISASTRGSASAGEDAVSDPIVAGAAASTKEAGEGAHQHSRVARVSKIFEGEREVQCLPASRGGRVVLIDYAPITNSHGRGSTSSPAPPSSSLCGVKSSSRALASSLATITEGIVLFKGPAIPCLRCKFKAMILTMQGIQPPIIPGASFELYLYGTEVECHISKLHRIIHLESSTHGSYSSFSSVTATATMTGDEAARGATVGGCKTGKVATKAPRPKCIGECTRALVTISTVLPVTVEDFMVCESLGRFALRVRGATVAVGVCVA